MTATKTWSKVFGPLMTDDIKSTFVSKSQKLFLQSGLTRFNDGMGIISPYLVRSLRKLEKLVREEMNEISAQEILLPTLTNLTLLETSGRINLKDVFRVEETGKKSYMLNPTCEEAITNFIASLNVGHHQLPCQFYQITNKFRNEKRAKSGLLRAKEFIMKDLYCFDSSEEQIEECYKLVTDRYHHLFNILKVPYVRVEGETGNIGGKYSHEFHFLSDAGEDELILCEGCGHNEKYSNNKTENNCCKCQGSNVKNVKGIEVGHTFNLGTRYTKPFNAVFKNKEGKSELLHMGCFGLGLTRILAASVEVLCTDKQIRWPLVFAPYLVCLIPPKAGSTEEKAASNIPELIYQSLNKCLNDEVVYFDRTSTSIGKRIIDAKDMGFPFLVVIGKNIEDDPPIVEVHDVYSNVVDLVQIPDVSQFLLNKLLRYSDNGILWREQVLNQ